MCGWFTTSDLTTQRGAHYLSVVGRLRRDVDLAAARVEMTTVSARIRASLANTNQGSYASVDPLREAIVGDVRPAMNVLLGAVGPSF
jgi:hypothetical protein